MLLANVVLATSRQLQAAYFQVGRLLIDGEEIEGRRKEHLIIGPIAPLKFEPRH